MSEEVPDDRSTANQVQEVTGNVVQAGHIGSMTVHYTSTLAAAPAVAPDPGGPPAGRGGLQRQALVVASIAVVAVAAATAVVTGNPEWFRAEPSTSAPAPQPKSATSAPPGTPTTTGSPPTTPAPRRPGSLSALKSIGDPVFRDDFVVVDEVPDVEAKTAFISCDGAPLAETYDLGGAYRTFTTRVGVKDKPANAGPVTFEVLVDGVVVANEPLPVARTEDIRIAVVGGRRLTLQVSTATCVTVGAAWIEPTLTPS